MTVQRRPFVAPDLAGLVMVWDTELPRPRGHRVNTMIDIKPAIECQSYRGDECRCGGHTNASFWWCSDDQIFPPIPRPTGGLW